MIVNSNNISTFSFTTFFKRYNVSIADMEYYISLIKKGENKKALSLFIEKYIKAPIVSYNTNITKYLEHVEKGELDATSKRNIEKSIALLSFGIASLLSENFNVYIKKIFSPFLFDERKITNRKVKKAILDTTLSQFETLTSNSLLGTQNYLLKNIRAMQKEFIVFNQSVRNLDKQALDEVTKSFMTSLKKRFTEFQKMKEGKLVISSPAKLNGAVRFYKLENYVEMSVRTTLLNIDRTSTEVYIVNKELEKASKRVDGVSVNVAEYALIDDRTLKTGIERVICKSILTKKKYGIPLVALNSKTASLLGIPLLSSAIAEGAFGVFCRHGLRPISIRMRTKLENIIKEKI